MRWIARHEQRLSAAAARFGAGGEKKGPFPAEHRFGARLYNI